MLSLSNVSVSHGKVQALHRVSMEVNEGQVVCLIGSNGAGKSTTLRAISALLPITEGSIRFRGIEISNSSVERIVSFGIIHVPENRRLFQGLTVIENLKAGAYLRLDKARVSDDLRRIYDYFPALVRRKNQFAGTLSGGEQQMLALARGFMAAPTLLLLDEPSFGLAPLIVEEIYDIIRRIKNEGVTILLVEQNAKKALISSDFGFILVTGRIVLSGKSQDLLERKEVREHYLGKGYEYKHSKKISKEEPK